MYYSIEKNVLEMVKHRPLVAAADNYALDSLKAAALTLHSPLVPSVW